MLTSALRLAPLLVVIANVVAAGEIPSGTQKESFDITQQATYWLDPRRAGIPKGWKFNPDAPLDENLIRPWPERYTKTFGQDFNAHRLSANVASACRLHEQSPTPDVVEFFEQMLDRIGEYSLIGHGAQFVLQRFEYNYRGHVLENPWTSALVNAHTLIAVTAMHDCAGLDTLPIARELLEALARPRKHNDPVSNPWVSYIDKDGYLWFEERTLDEPPHVLNGHNGTIIALYYYWQVTHDTLARALIEAGLTTVKAKALEYRMPGKTNRYDLKDPYYPDYGPRRTILQQVALYKISGDPAFKQYAELFMQDMPEAAEEARAFMLD